MVKDVKLYLALPVIDEFVNLPALIQMLQLQTERLFHLVVCVNHYEHWRGIADHHKEIEDNEKSLRYLKSVKDIKVTLIDKASPGCGWPKGKGGVGWARKLCMDRIAEMAQPQDIIVSVDADTYYPVNYLGEIKKTFVGHPKAIGLAVPYYHPLTGEQSDRLILRYELYMRHYAIQMLRINNPYAFSALGSAMAFPVWAYRKAGGITPVKSGEDFYFLQKLVKLGQLILWTETVAYPSSRFSSRVVFGTGPALIKGETGDWSSYPLYHPDFFDLVHETFLGFDRLFERDIVTPMDEFLFARFGTQEIWAPLRKNFKRKPLFVRACSEKVDGLRILQFLREKQMDAHITDESVIITAYKKEWPHLFTSQLLQQMERSDMLGLNIKHLDEFRQSLFLKENAIRKEKYFNSL
jgi:UDP-N-acetylglucosamine transferase subunit ALG13